MTMKSTGNGNGNGHHTVGTTSPGAGVTRSEPFENEFITFDSEDADSFAAESSGPNKRRRSKRVTGAFLLLLLIASVAIALYFILGGNRTPVNLNVRDTRTQTEKTQSAKQSQDDVTSQAIAEVRSSTGEAAQPVPAAPGANTTASRVSPSAPVTIPVDGLGGTVAAPVMNIPTTTGAPNTTDITASPATTGTTTTERIDKKGTPTASERNPERSIRCALPQSASVSNQTRSTLPLRQTESDQTARTDQGVVLPSFGSMLPVRSLGVLYTLRSGSLTRFELTRDMRGQGWGMKKGTVIVGVERGSEYDRAFVAIVGFIDSESGRFVKFTGDVLGGDGGAGLRGRRRSLSSTWSRAFSRIGTSAVNVAGLMLSGLGRSSVVVSDAYGYRVVNPVTSELSGIISERTNQQPRGFVEVPAGTQGYVMVTDLPQEIRGVDALAGLSAKDLAQSSDATGVRASTGLSERELADLISSGSVEQIRAALPRMTPEMRRVAEAVIAQSGE
jgi:cytoskeletal protein RodZ